MKIIITLLLLCSLASITQAQRKIKTRHRDCPEVKGLKMNAASTVQSNDDLVRLRDDTYLGARFITIGKGGDFFLSVVMGRGERPTVFEARGTLTVRGCDAILTHTGSNYRLKVTADVCEGIGVATLNHFTKGQFIISDRQKYKSEEK